MEVYRTHLKIESCPPALNAANKMHWGKRDAISEEWRMAVWGELKRKKITAPPKPLDRAKLTVIRHSHRMLDFDGMVGSMKPVIDALVKNGIILDDSWPVVGAWKCDQFFRQKKDGQLTEVIIEAINFE